MCEVVLSSRRQHFIPTTGKITKCLPCSMLGVYINVPSTKKAVYENKGLRIYDTATSKYVHVHVHRSRYGVTLVKNGTSLQTVTRLRSAEIKVAVISIHMTGPGTRGEVGVGTDRIINHCLLQNAMKMTTR